MGEYGPEMIRDTWSVLGELYHADLKNVAGPWDRAYGFDMNRYLSILALHMWTIVGKEMAPINKKVCTILFRKGTTDGYDSCCGIHYLSKCSLVKI